MLILNLEVQDQNNLQPGEGTGDDLTIGLSVGLRRTCVDNLLIILVVFLFLIVVLIIVGFLLWKHLLRDKRKVTLANLHEAGDTHPFKESFILNYSKILLQQKIGEGAFGEVFLGVYNRAPVAVKRLNKDFLSVSDLESFEAEAKLMSELPPHPNVVLM